MSSCRTRGRARSTRYRAHGPIAPERGLRFDRREGAARSVRPGRRRAGLRTTAWPRPAPGDNAATAMKSVVADPRTYDWEGDAPLRRPFVETHDLRAARARLHPAPQLGGGPDEARNLAGPDREDSVSPGPGHHRGGAAAGVPVRSAGRASRPRELLGLPAGLVLRAASCLQLAARAARRPRRVPRHGQGAASRRHRSDPRRRLQPHRRRRGGRADPVLSRAGERRLLHPRGRSVAVRRLHRLRQHAERQPADRAPADPGQPALLGHRDARRRVPLRSGVDPVARRERASRCPIRRCSGISSRIRCSPAPS